MARHAPLLGVRVATLAARSNKAIGSGRCEQACSAAAVLKERGERGVNETEAYRARIAEISGGTPAPVLITIAPHRCGSSESAGMGKVKWLSEH